jgi:hypothetical protein
MRRVELNFEWHGNTYSISEKDFEELVGKKVNSRMWRKAAENGGYPRIKVRVWRKK